MSSKNSFRSKWKSLKKSRMLEIPPRTDRQSEEAASSGHSMKLTMSRIWSSKQQITKNKKAYLNSNRRLIMNLKTFRKASCSILMCDRSCVKFLMLGLLNHRENKRLALSKWWNRYKHTHSAKLCKKCQQTYKKQWHLSGVCNSINLSLCKRDQANKTKRIVVTKWRSSSCWKRKRRRFLTRLEIGPSWLKVKTMKSGMRSCGGPGRIRLGGDSIRWTRWAVGLLTQRWLRKETSQNKTSKSGKSISLST